MFTGRHQLGDEITVNVTTQNGTDVSWPDAAPTATIYIDGSPINSRKIPAADRSGKTGLFRLTLFLGDGFSTGQYMMIVNWKIGSYHGVAIFNWEVIAGGSIDGSITSMYQYERPHARFLIHATDAGTIFKGTNPRV